VLTVLPRVGKKALTWGVTMCVRLRPSTCPSSPSQVGNSTAHDFTYPGRSSNHNLLTKLFGFQLKIIGNHNHHVSLYWKLKCCGCKVRETTFVAFIATWICDLMHSTFYILFLTHGLIANLWVSNIRHHSIQWMKWCWILDT